MTTANLDAVLRLVRSLAERQAAGNLTDGELLERFRTHREEAAFAILVERHGPKVLGACWRLLRNAHDAEDAFQATFLVLARNACSIRKAGSLAGWLLGVARRVAQKARARAGCRRSHERRVPPPAEGGLRDEVTWQELCDVLDEEVARLPAEQRSTLVLCLMEGKTQEQAAQELGLPKSTLASRLGRAREVLQQRLARRGITLTASTLAAVLAERSGAAALPARLLLATVRTAMTAASGPADVPASVLSLAEGVASGVALGRRKVVAAVLAASVFLVGTVAGTVALAYHLRKPAPVEEGPAGGGQGPPPRAEGNGQGGRKAVPDVDERLQQVLDGKIDRRHLCLEVSYGGVVPEEKGLARLHGNGCGSWVSDNGWGSEAVRGRPFTLPAEQVTALLKLAQAARLGTIMPRQIGEMPLPKVPPLQPRSVLDPPYALSVSLQINNIQKDVFYYVPGGRSLYKPPWGPAAQRVAELGLAVREACQKAAAKSAQVDGLKDGLEKIVRKELPPEHLRFSLRFEKCERWGKVQRGQTVRDLPPNAVRVLESWTIAVDGPFARAERFPRNKPDFTPLETILLLSGDELRELAKTFLAAEVAELPQRLVPYAPPMQGPFPAFAFQARVVKPVLYVTLGRELGGQKAVQVAPAHRKDFNGVVERLERLNRRVLAEGEPFWR
jgi:RNA polymerase sigma factor (sigma-70 family)